MSTNSYLAGKIVEFVERLPEKITNSEGRTYTKPELIGRTIYAISKRNPKYMTRAGDLRNALYDLLREYSSLGLEDLSRYLSENFETTSRPGTPWIQVNGTMDKEYELGKQGLKVHISLPEDPELAAITACCITGYLNSCEQVYKVVKSHSEWNDLNRSEQQGKAFAVYPESIEKSLKIMDDVSKIYQFLPEQPVRIIRDIEVTPGVGCRVSNYSGEDLIIVWKESGAVEKIDDDKLRRDPKLQKELFYLLINGRIEV